MTGEFNWLTFENVRFEDACKLMGGEIEKEGDIKICEIRKGLESYVMIEKKNNNIEIMLRSPRELTTLERLNNITETTCEVATLFNEKTFSLEPTYSECEFFSEPKMRSLIIKIRPQSSIIIHKYPIINIDNVKLYSTVGETEKRIQIHINFRDIFEKIYKERVKKVLEKLHPKVVGNKNIK